MKNKSPIQSEPAPKPSRRKYIIAAGLFVLLIFVVSLYAALSFEPKPDPESERVIRNMAASQLYKDPNELVDEDFAQITKLTNISRDSTFVWGQTYPAVKPPEFSDVKLLEKFTNLHEFELILISYPEDKIPKWMKILARLGVIDLEEKFYIDLKGLENLTSLRRLNLSHSDFRNIEPLANLRNLEELDLTQTRISDIKPLKKLKNLKQLNLSKCENISDKQIEELQKELPELIILND